MEKKIENTDNNSKYLNDLLSCPTVLRNAEIAKQIILNSDLPQKIEEHQELKEIYKILRENNFYKLYESKFTKDEFDPYVSEIDLMDNLTKKVKIGKQILKEMGLLK